MDTMTKRDELYQVYVETAHDLTRVVRGALTLIDQQANDPDLWVITGREEIGRLQRGLRRLHAALEECDVVLREMEHIESNL